LITWSVGWISDVGLSGGCQTSSVGGSDGFFVVGIIGIFDGGFKIEIGACDGFVNSF
jgi:hypothetical protein